jgi:DNA-binding response OmpR family regulator
VGVLSSDARQLEQYTGQATLLTHTNECTNEHERVKGKTKHMPSKTILVVDDQANVRTLLRDYLSEQGFHVVTAADGQEALYAARHERPALILLDIMMPEMDGYTFIRAHRREADTPIILLTAKLEETDKVLGLELGADDYVTKPFGMRELLARVRALLRRAEGEPKTEETILQGHGVRLDRSSRQVTVDGEEAELTPTEFELLATMMTTPNRVFSRSELLEAVHGVALETMERAITMHISNLRAKIEADPTDPQRVETVFGVGYRFSDG